MNIEQHPMSYIDWVRSADTSVVSESDLFTQYNTYVVQWYKEKKATNDEVVNYRRALYVDLLKEITINYSSSDERRFLTNIDYTDRREIDAILPFFVKRLKHITQYLIKVRQTVRYVKRKQNLKGSERGVAKAVKDIITDLLDDPDFRELYPLSNMPDLSSVVDNIYVEVEPLYDNFQNYFDINPDIDVSTIVTEDDRRLYNHYKSNTEAIDTSIWLDFEAAITQLLRELPILLQLNDDDSVCTIGKTSSQHNIGINVPRQDVGELPLNQFVNQQPSKPNLNVLYQTRLVEKYAGCTMYYLSTDSTGTSFVSGELFTPTNPAVNYLNRYNASHPSVPSLSKLHTVKDLGTFYTPDKEGILNFSRVNSIYKLDTSKLQPDNVYVFPDPELYGTGRGNSLTDNDSILTHHDDNRRIKVTKASQTAYGDIANDKYVQKFYPYQSKEETLQIHTGGISRAYDDVDFWEGEEKDIWAKNDIYEKLPLRPYPVVDKQNDLLISDNVMQDWQTDMYGNEFAVFKLTHPIRLTTEQVNANYTNTAIQESVDTSLTSVTGLFDYPSTTYYPEHLTGNSTQFDTKTDPLSSSITAYNRRSSSTASAYFRNVYSTQIGPMSSALSAVFIKYITDTDIKNEIDNDVRSIDLLGNIIILETTNFTVLEQYTYDYGTDLFTSTLPLKIYMTVSGEDPNFAKMGNHWYDETTKSIYFIKTSISPFISASNFKAIYPTIYVYDINRKTFSEVFSINTLAPSISSTSNLTNRQEAYNMLFDAGFVVGDPYTTVPLNSGTSLNIRSVDKPRAALNGLDNIYSVNFFGYDAANIPCLYNWYFDARDRRRFSVNQLDAFTPNNNIFSYNLGSYQDSVPTETSNVTISANTEGVFLRGGNENRAIAFEAFQPEIELENEQIINRLAYGSQLSGRDSNPSSYKDFETGTIRLGAGLSASQSDEEGKNSVEVTGTPILPYSHNTGYMVHSTAVSGFGNDIVITFDMAMWTDVSDGANSAYAQLSGSNEPEPVS